MTYFIALQKANPFKAANSNELTLPVIAEQHDAAIHLPEAN